MRIQSDYNYNYEHDHDRDCIYNPHCQQEEEQ